MNNIQALIYSYNAETKCLTATLPEQFKWSFALRKQAIKEVCHKRFKIPVTSIVLENLGVDKEDSYSLGFHISRKGFPKIVSLSNNPISGKELCILLPYSRITKLSLRNCHLGSLDAIAISKVLKNNSCLRELDLSRNQIGFFGGCALATSLKVNTTLKKLKLDYNDIGSVSASRVASALCVNSSLTYFSLNSNSLGLCCGFDRVLLRNRRLRTLKLRNCDIPILEYNINEPSPPIDNVLWALERNWQITKFELVSWDNSAENKIERIIERNRHKARREAVKTILMIANRERSERGDLKILPKDILQFVIAKKVNELPLVCFKMTKPAT